MLNKVSFLSKLLKWKYHSRLSSIFSSPHIAVSLHPFLLLLHLSPFLVKQGLSQRSRYCLSFLTSCSVVACVEVVQKETAVGQKGVPKKPPLGKGNTFSTTGVFIRAGRLFEPQLE